MVHFFKGIVFTGFVYFAQTAFIAGLVPLQQLNPAFRAIFKETRVTKLPRGINCKPDISYLFADLKYRDGEVKICEFGEGRNAAGNYSEVFYGNKVVHVNSPYWLLFWSYLTRFDVPVWYVGLNPETHYKENFVMQIREKVAWDQFMQMGGLFAQELDNLEKDPFFALCSSTNRGFEECSLGGCQGIIVYRHRDDRYFERAVEIDLFKKKYPGFIFLDDASGKYAANKHTLAKLLDTSELRQLKPQWNVYEKQYSSNLPRKILRDLKSKNVVIKPINSGRSNGVIMVAGGELKGVLQSLFENPEVAFAGVFNDNKLNIRPKNVKTHAYWRRDRNDVFLVESLEESKPLKVREKWYDPTMRVVFVLSCDGKNMHTTILGGYWEIPLGALSDACSLTDKHRSVAVHEAGYVGLRIEKKDWDGVKKILYRHLPKIYHRMLVNRAKGLQVK